jgi:phenylacetic acid degradation operon negative regulatory protein
MTPDQIAETHLQRFRAQRPLRAGSLILTVFGDALGPRGSRITLGSLIRLMSPFGLTDRLVRTSVGRLAADGWLRCERQGRLSEYALSDSGRERFATATRRIYSGPDDGDAQDWTLVLLPPAGTAHRAPLRELLRKEGFGELDPGLYAHPSIAPQEVKPLLPDDAAAAVTVFRSSPLEASDRPALAARAWDLGALAKRYRTFCATFAPAAHALRQPTALSPDAAFIIRTLLVHEYRRIHLRDPLLPSVMLPRDWSGAEAYALCRTVYSATLARAEEHLSTVAARLDGPLPAPTADLYRRFPHEPTT